MSVARWPAELPQYPLRAGLDVEPIDTDVRGQTATGTGTVRPGELGEWNKVRCTVALRSRDERDRLLAWHRNALIRGTQAFEWPGLDASVGDESYRYIFSAQPKRAPRGVHGWRMALELMTLPAPPPVALVLDGEPQ